MRRTVLVGIGVLSACTPAPKDGSDKDVLASIAVSREIQKQLVVYSDPGSQQCLAFAGLLEEAYAANDVAPARNGLMMRDLKDAGAYRIYYSPGRPLQMNEGSFVICEGSEAAYVPVQCRFIGATPKGCFETGIYSISGLKDFDVTVEAIYSEWPDSSEQE